MKRDQFDFEAQVRFLTEKEGGRKSPVSSGYRPDHFFGIEDQLHCVFHEYIGTDLVNPGETVAARMSFLVPEVQYGRLFVGFDFLVQEGRRVVGQGTVTKLLDERFRKV